MKKFSVRKKVILTGAIVASSLSIAGLSVGITYAYIDRTKVLKNDNNYGLRIDTTLNTDTNAHKFHGQFNSSDLNWVDAKCEKWVDYQTLGCIVYMQQNAQWGFKLDGWKWRGYGDITLDSSSDSGSTYIQNEGRNFKTMQAGYYLLGYNWGEEKLKFKKL